MHSVVNKRLRALRKKQNRIAHMEEAVAAGKTLNQEQTEVMRSKPTLAAVIDELERLRAPLAVAVAEEVSVSVAPAPASAPAPSASGSDSSVQDLLALVYFGALFYVKPQRDFIATMAAREHERTSCITYDCVGDDTVDLLVEGDLDVVSAVADLASLHRNRSPLLPWVVQRHIPRAFTAAEARSPLPQNAQSPPPFKVLGHSSSPSAEL